MNEITKKFFASVVSVSELQQSDIYLTIKARLFETPGANLNGVRVTSQFLDEIVQNEQKYVTLPLCADVKSLANGNYEHLGHLYDAHTGEFHSTQIGSFYHYEKEFTPNGAALIGYARVMKRNKAVCKAIAELFAAGALKFSFEITCGKYTELADGTVEIDADVSNFLEGAAIVTFPACEDAVALELVAECDQIANDEREGEEMTDVTEITQEAEVISASATEAESAIESASCKKEKTATEYTTEKKEVDPEKDKPEEVASTDPTDAKDQKETAEHEVVSETKKDPEKEEPAKEDPMKDDSEKKEEDPEEKKDPEDESMASKKKKCASEDADTKIAELISSIEVLKTQIAELKKSYADLEEEKIVAEKQVVAEKETTANPFIAEITAEAKGYSLLESYKSESGSKYSLLDKA